MTSILALFIPLIAGIAASRLWVYVEDGLKWEQGLGTDVQALIATALGAIAPLIVAKFGIQIPTDLGAVGQPQVQAIIAAILTLILKGHANQAKLTASLKH